MGWQVKRLGEVASVACGSGFPKKYQGKSSGKYPFFKVSDMNFTGNEIYMTHAANYVDVEDLVTLKAKYHSAGTIVFPKVGGAIATNKKRLLTCDAFFDNNVMGVTPKTGLSSEFIYKFFLSLDLYDLSNKAALPSITGATVQELKIPLPPIPEQQRIVAILDQAFADIEKARANAEQNLKNARELFDSYLQQVFSQWGDGWTTRMMSDKSLLQMVDGDRGHNYPKKSDFKDEGHCLFLSTKNVRPNGFKFQDTVFISEERDNLLRKGRLKRNDVLITTRGTIGNLALFDDSVKYKNIRINSGMLILRPNVSQILPSYLFEIMRSNIVKSQVLAKTSGAAQPQLPIQTLNTFSFPVPESLIEQKEMVLKLQELEKKASMLQAVYLHKLDSLDELKKSLLQKAFSGELTKSKGIAA